MAASGASGDHAGSLSPAGGRSPSNSLKAELHEELFAVFRMREGTLLPKLKKGGMSRIGEGSPASTGKSQEGITRS